MKLQISVDSLPVSDVVPDISTACGVRAFIEPVETVRQVGGELQPHHMASPCKRQTIREESYLFMSFTLADLKIQRTIVAQEQSSGDVEPLAVEDESSGVQFNLQEDLDSSAEGQGGQVGVDQEVIMMGFHSVWQSHLIPGEMQCIGVHGC